MKLLMLTRYARTGASSRMRSYQYLPWLEAAGIDVTVSPLFSDAYVDGLQLGQKKFGVAAGGYLRRVVEMLHSTAFDLVWIEKEALPWLPMSIERLFLSKRIPYVLDYDDAVFHLYDQNKSAVVRALLAEKHPALMRGAALVISGNAYLADIARQAGARWVEIVPTVVDLSRYAVTENASSIDRDEPPCIGWIGQRATAPFLMPYRGLFERLSMSAEARFAAIGIDAQAFGLPMKSIPWSEQTEVASIATFDIGIMPLFDEPFERGKCGYKLIQYMACGLPVVASPVGANNQIVEHGVNGFLAETSEQWEYALKVLLQDSRIRQQMGESGRRKVEQKFCIQVTGPSLTELLAGVVSLTNRTN